MRIGKPELIDDAYEIRISAPVEFQGRDHCLWYAVEKRYADYVSTHQLDAFAVGLLVPAMAAQEDIHIKGPISAKLYWSLTHYYMRIMSSVIPTLQPVRILPDGLNSDWPMPRPTGVLTGFSGGIDSFCVLADHLFGDVSPEYKVSHLIYNNVGSHGRTGGKLFAERYARLRAGAEELGLPLIRIDSNIDEFYPMKFEQTHAPRNASAVLLLQKLFGKYLYASTFKYEDCFVGPANDIAYSDPLAVPLLSTEATECISVGCQYSRVEKTMRVAELELSYRYLDVCTGRRGEGNCGLCWKCARTLLTLDLLGKTSLYEKVFPLDTYRSAYNRCVAKVLVKDNPLTREVICLARRQGYRFPWGARALSVVRRAEAHLRSLLRP